jgi:hypothetical protein
MNELNRYLELEAAKTRAENVAANATRLLSDCQKEIERKDELLHHTIDRIEEYRELIKTLVDHLPLKAKVRLQIEIDRLQS